jgi:hypothetical protein
MKRLLTVIFLLFLAIPAHAQYVATAYNIGGAGAVTPALVNFRGMPSTETAGLGTKTFGTCATNSYCTATPDATLAGNGIIVFYTYRPASGNTANVPTIHDCTTYGCTTNVDTFTSCGTEGNQATDHIYVGCAYVLTATTGSRNITCQWSAVVTQASCSAASFMNVTAVDAYATNSGSATGTFSSGSVTAGFANDLYFSFVAMTCLVGNGGCNAAMPTNVGLWTPGSQAGITWTADLADRRDALFIQHGVKTATGALNPASSNATTTQDYVGLTVAFKAGASGTAPSGMHICGLYTVNSASGTGNLSYQVNSCGNLIVGFTQSGSQQATGMSDTTNGSPATWKACGPVNNNVTSTQTATYYFPNSATGLLPVTVTTSGTGDIGPAEFYAIAGAATTQQCAHAAPAGDISATGATFAATTNYTPSASAGITLYGIAVEFNILTTFSVLSGGLMDMNTAGGQSLSGPSVPDQNNGGGHITFASNAANNLTWNLSDSATAIGVEATEIDSFQAPGATLNPMVVKQANNESATNNGSIAVTSYVPYQSGDILAVHTCSTNSSGTITISDPTNGTYTTADGPTNFASAGVYCKTAYVTNIAATTVTITATYSGGNTTFHNIMVWEIANATAIDKHNLVGVTSSTNGLITGTSSGTLSFANEVAVGGIACNNTCDYSANQITAGVNLQPWTINIIDAAGHIGEFLSTAATTAIAASGWDKGGTGLAEVSSLMTFH